MAAIKKGKITDLHFDDKNFNKGSVKGAGLMTKSFQAHGAGRSVLVDKNNNLIAGNKSAEEFGQLGGEDIIIVETTGDKLVVVKRTDVDLNTKKGREMALADNASALANIVMSEELIIEELGIEALQEWHIPDLRINPDDFGDKFDLNSGPRPPFQQMTFTLADEQAEELKLVISELKKSEVFKTVETFGNDNANGNALYLILSQWVEQRRSL